MELDGSRMIGLEPEALWHRLNDAATLQAAIPLCESLEGSPEEGFDAVVKAKVGPVRATFKGRVAIEDATPPRAYRLVGEGKGGVAGFAKGSADIRLEPVAGGTELHYVVTAQVGGKLAQMGNRIVGGFAKSMADRFFDRLEAVIEGRDPDAAPPDGTDADA